MVRKNCIFLSYYNHSVITTIFILDSCNEKNVHYFNEDNVAGIIYNVENENQCRDHCIDHCDHCIIKDKCYFWCYDVEDKMCWLKSSNSGKNYFPGRISGPKDCGMFKFAFLIHIFNSPKHCGVLETFIISTL